MFKSEENDIFRLIDVLNDSEAKSFQQVLLSPKKAVKPMLNLKISLFSEIRKKKRFDSQKFIKKKKLDQKKYTRIKHFLFQDILDFIKSKYNKYSDIELENKIMDFEVLVTNGFFIKANRRLNQIKAIAFEKCNFSICVRLQRKAIKYRLFDYDKNVNSVTKAYDELKKFYELSDNLNAYMQLSDEVLNFHFMCQDKRAKCSKEILKYLDHQLLKDLKLGLSILAKYYFFRIKSLIYLGNNDFEACKMYSLKAFNYLNSNPSIYRNDFWHFIRCKNNYLEGSLGLMETKPFERMYPEIEQLVEKTIAINKKDIYLQAFSFQFLCNLRLRYLWLTKDNTTFSKEYQGFKKLYLQYQSLIWPSFRVEILLGFARMKFLSGELNTANEYCNQILNEKTSPSSLYITCGNLLRIMVNFDRDNHLLMPHLISSSTYALKKRNRLFELERTFLNGLKKIKPYHSQAQSAETLNTLKIEINELLNTSSDMIIDKNIRILEWLGNKVVQIDLA